MRKSVHLALRFALVCSAACSRAAAPPPARWTLAPASAALAQDNTLRDRIFRALDAAEHAGTDPGVSKFKVRCATVVDDPAGGERVIVGGNSEYALAPEAIHGETSLVNHAINLLRDTCTAPRGPTMRRFTTALPSVACCSRPRPGATI